MGKVVAGKKMVFSEAVKGTRKEVFCLVTDPRFCVNLAIEVKDKAVTHCDY